MFKILNFQNKIVEKLLVFRCSEIRNTKYDIRYTRYDTIMQNKPNFRKPKMNVYPLVTMDYENISDWTLGENKPNSNPIKPNFRKAQMNINSLITKDYRKNEAFAVPKNKPNSNPIQTQSKPISNECKAGYCPGVFRLIQLRKPRVIGCTVGPVPGVFTVTRSLNLQCSTHTGTVALSFLKDTESPALLIQRPGSAGNCILCMNL